jgi:hypothetical protein
MPIARANLVYIDNEGFISRYKKQSQTGSRWEEGYMKEEFVIYNGVRVHPDWPEKMKAFQRQCTYTINGVAVGRIRYGDEAEDWGADRGPCHDCAALKGQFHAFELCDVERCPVCGEQALGCDCDYEGDSDT